MLPSGASADWLSAVNGSGDAEFDRTIGSDPPLIIDASGGLLDHNLSGVGGFASAFDFDSSVAGNQTLSASAPARTLTINGTAGTESVGLGDAEPISAISTQIHVFLNDGADFLGLVDASSSTGKTLDVFNSSVAGFNNVQYSDIENLTVTAGQGNDTINIDHTAPDGTNVQGGGGNDTIATLDGKSIGALTGGSGTDTLDFHFWTSPAQVSAPTSAVSETEFMQPSSAGVALGVENYVGGSGADTLVGTSLANALTGAGGNDTLTGGLGADSFDGGADNDTVNAQDGVADALLECGAGTGDTLTRDIGVDPAPLNCETVNQAPAPADSDGDGVPDSSDGCPTVAASTANGCPVDSGGGGGTLPPSNDITIGKAKLNTKKGTATLPVQVPGAGTLSLAGKGLKIVSSISTAAGRVNMKVKPTGRTADKLDAEGKARVTPEVTFTPSGGSPNTESTRVTLKQN